MPTPPRQRRRRRHCGSRQSRRPGSRALWLETTVTRAGVTAEARAPGLGDRLRVSAAEQHEPQAGTVTWTVAPALPPAEFPGLSDSESRVRRDEIQGRGGPGTRMGPECQAIQL